MGYDVIDSGDPVGWAGLESLGSRAGQDLSRDCNAGSRPEGLSFGFAEDPHRKWMKCDLAGGLKSQSLIDGS